MLYEIRFAANKGLGLFAKDKIPRGTRILAEKPLIALRPGQRPSDILSYAKRLDGKSRERLLGLSWHPGGGIKRIGRWVEALGWVVRDRVANSDSVAKEDDKSTENTSAVVPTNISGLFKEMGEALQILGIFRSNSFNLASATVPTTTRMPSMSPTDLQSQVMTSPPKESSCTKSELSMESPSPSPPYALALFPGIARINHSCLPNAQANYHPLHKTFNIHATRDIPAGEEVSINYLPEHGQSRDQRVSKLEEGYGFACNCSACNLDTKEGRQGELSRKDMQNSMKRMKAALTARMKAIDTVNAGYGADGMPEIIESSVTEEELQQSDALRELPEAERQAWLQNSELKILNLMIEMYRKEGIVGREVASIRYHIARLEWSIGHHGNALMNAQAGLKLEEDCLGEDHPGYLEALAFVEGIRNEIDSAQGAETQDAGYAQ